MPDLSRNVLTMQAAFGLLLILACSGGDEEVKMTLTEYSLLSELATHKGKVMTHKMLLQQVWGIECGEEVDYLRVFVNRLRHKLQDDSSNPKYIHTETGVGYRFMVDQLQQANAGTATPSQSTALSG